MGWWPWPSSASASGDAPAASDTSNNHPTDAKFGLSEQQRLRIFGPAGAKPSATTASNASTARDQTDAEVELFLQSLDASDNIVTASKVDNSATTTPASTPQSLTVETHPDTSPHDRILADGSLNIHPSALHPRTMSCRAAFDQAFYCQSVGGKFNDIYRFGALRDCSEQWGAFWFCMRTRTLPEHEKQNQIRDYYEQRDMRRKAAHGSSEDVWEIRTKAVESAFGKDPDADDAPREPLVRG